MRSASLSFFDAAQLLPHRIMVCESPGSCQKELSFRLLVGRIRLPATDILSWPCAEEASAEDQWTRRSAGVHDDPPGG